MLGPLCLFQNRDRDCEEEAATAAPFVAFPSSCRQSFPSLPPCRPPIIANQEKKTDE